MVKFVFTPEKKVYQIFFMWSTICYFISYFMDPFEISFRLQPLLSPRRKTLQTILSANMLVDIFLMFFTAYQKEAIIKLQDETLENKKQK